MKTEEEFNYSEGSSEYLIKLKKRKRFNKMLLLLLLLLLPLLLLITFKKDVVFKTVDNIGGAALSSADLKFIYTERKLIDFNDFSFFTAKTVELSGLTDTNGIIVFPDVSYTLYARLFFSSEKTKVLTAAGCFAGDSLEPYFSKLKHRQEELLTLKARAYDLDFQIVDAEDNQPIPEANVDAKLTIAANEQQWNEKSNSHGVAELKQLSYCSDKFIIIAQRYGYLNDTIESEIQYLTADINLRTLYMQPIKGTVDITIKDITSKEPVPNATAKLVIKNDTLNFITNTNGIGKGVFDSVKVLNEMQIFITHVSYYDTTTQVYKVEEFLSLDETSRTVYIRPKTTSLAFRDIDGSNGALLAGTSNEIYVNSTKIDNIISNANGVFVIPNLNATDKVTIYATKTGYEPNKTKINNKNVSELATKAARDIPLNQEPPPPTVIEPPKDNCRAHFSGTLLSDNFINGHISTIYKADAYGEYVGAGSYPSNKAAFPKAVARTFDGIAIDKGTRVVIYSEPNFKGTVVLDIKGPAVINNIKWKDESRIKDFNTKTFSGTLDANFPKASRIWSSVNMNDWDNGSLKITCD